MCAIGHDDDDEGSNDDDGNKEVQRTLFECASKKGETR